MELSRPIRDCNKQLQTDFVPLAEDWWKNLVELLGAGPRQYGIDDVYSTSKLTTKEGRSSLEASDARPLRQS